MRAGVVAAGSAAAAGLAWALFESQWVDVREVEVPLPGLPPELDGFRILHLSDFHLGALSLNARTVERALAWADGRAVDLVAVTGDLLSRRRGERALRAALARLRARHGVYAILGNHDVAETRDPFSEPAEISDLAAAGAVLLADSARSFTARGVRVQVVGVEPLAYARGEAAPARLADRSAALRILLCHFPEVVERLPPDTFHLVLAGHLHGGQICLPYPGGKVRLSHVRGRYWEGLFRLPTGVLHVSRGLGTTFVPFRLFARPDATELVLRRA